MLKSSLQSRILLFSLFIFLSSLSSQVSASLHRADSFTLPNGLRVVIKRDPSASLTALQLWVEAGSADEDPESGGVAHVLEHILFRGSSESGGGKLAGEIESLGGRINGFTTRDQTVYHMILPAIHLQSGLRVLAKMMQLPSLDESQLGKEIQVVMEEWRQGQDNPRARVASTLFGTAYRLHPYGRPTIGTPETLKRITWEALSDFYHRWYAPNNMTLVVVGKLEEEELKTAINDLFASLPARELPLRRRLLEPLQSEPRFTIVRGPVRQSHLLMGFPIPQATAKESPALDLLAFILGRGESSRLAQRVKVTAGVVNSISASTFVRKDPGLFLIGAQAESGNTIDALKAILKEVYRLRDESISPSELSRAHVNFSRTFVETKETLQRHGRLIGQFQSLYRDPNYEETYLEGIRRLEAEGLRSVAQKFLSSENLSVALLVPEGATNLPGTEEMAALARSLERPPMDVSVKGGPRILRATLENGLRVIIQENRALPVFAVHAAMVGGLVFEDESNNGIHNFIAAMLTQGTRSLTSARVVREVEALGGILSGSAGDSTFSLSGVFPSHEAQRGLEMFLEVLFHPTFPEDELEKKRREILIRIKNREERLQNQVFRLFYQSLFRNHPYRLYPLGQTEQVSRLSREDLRNHYQKLVSPDRLVLAIVGDVQGEEVLKRLEDRLSSIPASPSDFSIPSIEDESGQIRTTKKGVKTKQAHVVLGFSAPAKGHPDFFAMKVLQIVLSRMGGRLFVELRDKQGLAYSVGAFSLDDPYQGAFGIYAATDPSNIERLREGIVREIKKIQDEEIPSEELDRAKNYLIGNHLIALQSNGAKAAQLALTELFGLGPDFSERYQEEIKKVTASDILRFARNYLPLNRYTLAIMGP